MDQTEREKKFARAERMSFHAKELRACVPQAPLFTTDLVVIAARKAAQDAEDAAYAAWEELDDKLHPGWRKEPSDR